MNKYFIYTGNAYPHKNLGRLIDAIISLNKNIKVDLLIVSARNVFVERLERMIVQKKAQKIVRVLGFQEDKELINLYKNSLAFVYPTLSEGFGLPPMEAVNAGTLSVVSDIPVLKEIYGDSVLYFNPLDQNSIAHTLNEVFVMDKVQRQKRLKYGQDFVKKYSWYKMAQETLKIYEQFSK